jgi:hypothetical protein
LVVYKDAPVPDTSMPTPPDGRPWSDVDDADAPPPVHGPATSATAGIGRAISFGQAVRLGAGFGLGFWLVGFGLALVGIAAFALLVMSGFR